MTNFLDPAIPFFLFGIFAGLVKSKLEIPQPISRFLPLYLLQTRTPPPWLDMPVHGRPVPVLTNVWAGST